MTFGIGPTGTGKSHLAIAAAVSLLAREPFKYLVLTRPYILSEGEVMTAERRLDVVEEGQLTPIEDELSALIGHEPMNRLKEEGRLQVLPLGLRGRTFNDGLLLVDDAQNLTIPQMRMALTRMGRSARIVITGDPHQSELHGDDVSGLTHALKLLDCHSFCVVHQFREPEIVRNPVVAEIEALYSGALSIAERGKAPSARIGAL